MQRFHVYLCLNQNTLMRKNFFFVLIAFCLAVTLHAQDKIIYKNGRIVKAKVTEVGTSEVKYKSFENPDGPVYVVEQDKIAKIVYENGRTESFTPNLKDPELYEGQLRKAIKVDFIGPLLGYTQITYEKSTGVGKSYELTLGIIGAGKNQRIDWYDNTLRVTNRNQFGLSAGVGYKFNKLPDFLFGKTRFTHLMQGAYAKPTFYIGNYSENRVAFKANNQYEVERRNVTFSALQIELGKQWIFGDRFAMDLYWGFGYGIDSKKTDDPYYISYQDDASAYNYINARAGRNPGFSLTYGLKVGWLLK